MMSVPGFCSECEEEKLLTSHGTCWRCHIKGISINTSIIARKKTPPVEPQAEQFKRLG